MVVAAFLLVTFAAVSGAFHSIQRAMAETAAAAGVQVAASGSPAGPNTPADPNTPYLSGAFQPTHDLLRSVMFQTAIVQVPPGQQCGSMDQIAQATLQVCAYPDGSLVAETVRGHPNFPIPWITRFLPWSIDVTVEMHEVTYQR